MPGITKLAAEYSSQGLNVLLFPTDQVTTDISDPAQIGFALPGIHIVVSSMRWSTEKWVPAFCCDVLM